MAGRAAGDEEATAIVSTAGRGTRVEVSGAWTGPGGHLLHESWVPPWFRDGLAVLITELEAAGLPGLGDRRTAFRQQGQVAGSRALSRCSYGNPAGKATGAAR